MNRLSLNQITTKRWSLPEAVRGCADAGVQWISLWRDKVAEVGVDEAARLMRQHEVRPSSLCLGGFFTGMGPDGPTPDGIADTTQAIDEAARLGAKVLVLVVGGVADGDLALSRRRVTEALEQLVPVALDRGVQLGLEPLHPMQCAERSVLSTLAQALDLAEPYPADAVGVVVDEFHVWWDPAIEQSLGGPDRRLPRLRPARTAAGPPARAHAARRRPDRPPSPARVRRRGRLRRPYRGRGVQRRTLGPAGDEVLREVVSSYQAHVCPR